jgi:hypothetical protein
MVLAVARKDQQTMRSAWKTKLAQLVFFWWDKPCSTQEESMRAIRICFAVCAALAVCGSPSRAQVGQPFLADLKSTLSRTGITSTGKIYFSPPKIRMDTNSHGRESIMIIDASTKTSYMLMPQQHAYMEFHVDATKPSAQRPPAATPSYDPAHPCPAGATCKRAGTETVNGRVCENWEMTTARGTTRMCIDQKLMYPIKTVMADGAMTELSNVKEGKPDPSVFEIPAGYRKMEMGSMGGRPPQ